MRNRVSVYAFVLVVVVCAAWLLDTLLPAWALDAELLLTVVAFAVFVTGIEFLEVRTSDGFRWAPSSTVDHAAWMLFGPVAAMLIRGLAIVIGDGFVRRRPPLRVLFNTATVGSPSDSPGRPSMRCRGATTSRARPSSCRPCSATWSLRW